MRQATRFEQDVMRMRAVFIGAALAAIVAGVVAFVIGLRQPIEPRPSDAPHVGVASTSIDVGR